MPSEAPTWEESTATPTWENSTETPTWEDSSDTPQKQGYAAAVGNSLAQEAVKGVGHALAGYGSLTEIMPVSAGVGAAPSAYDIQENIRRSRRTAAQVMTAIQQNPAVRMGQAIAAAAPEAYPVDSSRAQQFGPKAAGTVGSFLPLVASGPLAPATIGLQSLGAHVDEDWTAAKAEGLSDDAAAARALNRGLASGGLQAAIFFALPAPLRTAGEKYLINKFGTSAVKEFLAGRVALGAEGAVLGGTSTMAENVVSDRPAMQGVGAGAAGLGALNLVMPPYFPRGRNRVADNIEGELNGGASVPASSPGPVIIPPERQLRAPAIITPPPESAATVKPLSQILWDIDQLVRDQTEPPLVSPNEPPAVRPEYRRESVVPDQPVPPRLPWDEPTPTVQQVERPAAPGYQFPREASLIPLGDPKYASQPVANLVGGVFRSPEGFIGRLVPAQDGRLVLDNGRQQFELPAPPDATVKDAGLRAVNLQEAAPISPGQYPADPMPVLSRLQTSRNVAAFRRGIAEANQAEAKQAATESSSPASAAPAPELPEASRQLISAVVKVAGDAKAPLDLRYGALEALPTAKRVLSGFITRLEEGGAGKQVTDPLYQHLADLEKFENSYLDVVTKPVVQRGRAKVSDISPRKESPSTPEAVKPTENVPAAATPPVAAPEQSVETKPATENVVPVEVTPEQFTVASTAKKAKGATKENYRNPHTLFRVMQGEAETQGIPEGLAADRGDVSVSLTHARSGSTYLRLMANDTGEIAKIRFADHFAPGGGGFRVTDMGSGREAPPDFNIVKNKIYVLENGKWEQINLDRFRWYLENWLPENANATVAGGAAGIKTPLETQSQRAEAQAGKSNVSALPTEEGSALTDATKAKGATVVKPASSENPGILSKAQAAVEGRIDEIKREGRVRAFGDPELGGLRVAQGAIYVIKGVKNFAEWSAQMVKRFGNEIKPHLEDLWEQAKQVAAGTHPTIGLSQHGVKTIANEELSASVREALNVHYAKLTDESARTIAGARIAEAGGPLPAAAKLNAGAFDGEPGKVQNAIAAATMRRLSLQERLARERGEEQQADALADAQVAVAQRSIDRSPDAGQTLQSFKLFYEQFSPAAWLRKFKKDIGQVAVTRTEAAIGKPVEPSPAGVAQGIADKVGEETAKRNPKLGRIIQEEFGTAGTAEGTARPVGETLADRLERTGRAAKGKGKAVADKISKFYQEEVGKFRRLHGIPAFDPATQRDILRRAKAIDALPEDSVQRREAAQELMNHIRRLKGFQWWELPLDFWYANILSGPVTHLKNISGNAASLGAEVGLQIMRQPSALPSIIEALGRALPRGATEAANILRTGRDTASRHAGKFETHGALDAVTGTAGKLLLPWKLVGRALKAADVMFFYPLQETKGAVLASRASGLPIFNGERAAEVRRIMGWSEQARAKAAAQAKAEGLTGNTARRREYELLEQARPETLMESARDFAFHGTFNNDPYGVLGAVQRGFERTAREVPALKLIAPFTRIITNITNSGMNWTPVGYWRAARAQGLKLLIGRETNTGKLYGRTISDPTAVGDAYARATVGSLALGGLAMAAGQYVFDRNPQFMVTGSGPADPDQRKLLRQTGWIPYSIKIGDRYYTYQDKTWAMPLGVVGHYLDAIRYRKLDQQDALNRAAFALSSSFNVIVQSSWLQGLSAIFDQAGRDSVKNPLKALPSQALRTASSFVVPNALRQVDQMFDPTRYTADDIQAMMLAQLPLARRENRPDLNVFGEPVAAPLSKTFLSKVEGDGLTRMLAARRLWPGVPADPYLTPAQTYALVKYRGPQLRAELLANYADLATLPHAEANALLARLSRDATVQAKKDLGLDTLSGIEKQVSKFNER